MINKPQQTPTKRKPDCVTEVRVGNTTLIVKGYLKRDATETAVDKMTNVIVAEAATNHFVSESISCKI